MTNDGCHDSFSRIDVNHKQIKRRRPTFEQEFSIHGQHLSRKGRLTLYTECMYTWTYSVH